MGKIKRKGEEWKKSRGSGRGGGNGREGRERWGGMDVSERESRKWKGGAGSENGEG